MILYEFEGKKMLAANGITIPQSELITSPDQNIKLHPPLVLKAQVLSGKRKDAGGIVIVDTDSEAKDALTDLFAKTINGEQVTSVLIEEKLKYDGEYYLSVAYNSDFRSPVITFSDKGGTGIEERGAKIVPVNPLSLDFDHKDFPKEVTKLLPQILTTFFANDCLLLEINPLVVANGGLVALDAKVKLEDVAKARHSDWTFPPRNIPGHISTKSEIEAKKIDEGDYRGTAGAAFFDLPGDIAVLSSGGGVSLTALDSLIACGGKPANFTEYSGNPPKEKVVKLTKIVLDKPTIHGLWVIGTVVANFTDIYETLSGLIEGLREAEKELKTKFDFPIVIRRGGPRDKEAFTMLKKVTDFKLILQGSETSIGMSAKVMTDEAQKYAHGTKVN